MIDITPSFSIFSLATRATWINMEPRGGDEDQRAYLEDLDQPHEVRQQEQEAEGARRLRQRLLEGLRRV